MAIDRMYFQLSGVICGSITAVAGLIILFVGIGFQAATNNYDPSQESTIECDCRLINITRVDPCDYDCGDVDTVDICSDGTRYVYEVIANVSDQCGVQYESQDNLKLLKKDTYCLYNGDTSRRLNADLSINDTFTCYSDSCSSSMFEDEWYCIGSNCGAPSSNGKSEITTGWAILIVSVPMFIMFFVATYCPIKKCCDGGNICECCCDCCKCPSDYV